MDVLKLIKKSLKKNRDSTKNTMSKPELPPEEELSKKSVQELREILQERGITPTRLARKEDLIRLIHNSEQEEVSLEGEEEESEEKEEKISPRPGSPRLPSTGVVPYIPSPRPPQSLSPRYAEKIPKLDKETLQKLTLRDLRGIASEYNIRQSGRKDELIERILRFQRGEGGPEIHRGRGRPPKIVSPSRPLKQTPKVPRPKGRPKTPRSPLTEGPLTAERLQRHTVEELKDLLRQKGISTSGKKAELIERLLHPPPPRTPRRGSREVRTPSRSAPRSPPRSPAPSRPPEEGSSLTIGSSEQPPPLPPLVSKPSEVPAIPPVSSKPAEVPAIPPVSAPVKMAPGLPPFPASPSRPSTPKGPALSGGIPAPRHLPTVVPSRFQAPTGEMPRLS